MAIAARFTSEQLASLGLTASNSHVVFESAVAAAELVGYDPAGLDHASGEREMFARLLGAPLLRQVAEMEPISYSQEGLDDGCFFCGADHMRYTEDRAFVRYVEHKRDCTWVHARAVFGIPIAPHLVASADE